MYSGRLFPEISELINVFTQADAEPDIRNTKAVSELEMRAVSINLKLRAGLRTRKVGITSYSWDIVAHNKDATEGALEAKERLNSIIKKVLRQYYLNPTYGALAIQLKWVQPENSYWVPIIVKKFRPDMINWADDAEQLGTWDINGNPVLITSTVKERDNLILCSDETFESGGDLRPALIGQILRNSQLQEWANFNEMLKGILLTKIGDPTNVDDVKEGEVALADARTRKAVITGPDTNLSFIETVSSLGSGSFESFIRLIDTDAQIGLVGQANTMELPKSGGSYAALAVQNMISADISYDDMSGCQDMINEQILKPYYKRNKKTTGGTPPWEFQFIWQENATQESRVATIANMLDAGLPVVSSEAYSLAGMTKPDGVPDVIASGYQYNTEGTIVKSNEVIDGKK